MSDYQQLWHSLVPLYEAGEAQAVVRLLLAEGFGLSLADCITGAIGQMSSTEQECLQQAMTRLQTGEPVQQVLGYAWFCGRRFSVSPAVLTPRPETEELCQWVCESTTAPQSRLLDVGTGSGCIACTLALNLPAPHVTAVDISAEALRVAQDNANRLGASVQLLQLDILQPDVAGPASFAPNGTQGEPFDVIVSNPPYIMQSERTAMHPNVLEHEPHLALFVPDDDPLRFYHAIALHARQWLRQGGWLYFEINPLCADRLKHLLQSQGFDQVTLRNDAQGCPRMMRAQKKIVDLFGK